MVAQSYLELIGVPLPADYELVYNCNNHKLYKTNNPIKSQVTEKQEAQDDAGKKTRLRGCIYLYNLITCDKHLAGKQYIASIAITLFNQYFLINSLMDGGNLESKIPAMYLVASRLGFNDVDLRRIISNDCHLRNPGDRRYHNEKYYDQKVKELVNDEKYVAKQLLDQSLEVLVPHTAIILLVQKIEKEKMANIRLVGTAFRMATDILIVTDWSIRYNFVAIGTATLKIAAFFLDVNIDNICSRKYVKNWYDVIDKDLNKQIVNAMVKEFLNDFANDCTMHIGSLIGIDIHKKLKFGNNVSRPPPRQDLLRTSEPSKIASILGQLICSPRKNQDSDDQGINIIELFDNEDVSSRKNFERQSELYAKPRPWNYVNWVIPYMFFRPVFRSVDKSSLLRRCRSWNEIIDERKIIYTLYGPASTVRHSLSMSDVTRYAHAFANGTRNQVMADIKARKLAERKAKLIRLQAKQQAKLTFTPEPTSPEKAEDIERYRSKCRNLAAELAKKDIGKKIEQRYSKSYDTTYLPMTVLQHTTPVKNIRDTTNDHLFAPIISLSDGVKLILRRGKYPMIAPEDRVIQQSEMARQIAAAAREGSGVSVQEERTNKESVFLTVVNMLDAPTQCRIDSLTEVYTRCCAAFFTTLPGCFLIEEANHVVMTNNMKPEFLFMQLVEDAPVQIFQTLEFIVKDLTRGKRAAPIEKLCQVNEELVSKDEKNAQSIRQGVSDSVFIEAWNRCMIKVVEQKRAEEIEMYENMHDAANISAENEQVFLGGTAVETPNKKKRQSSGVGIDNKSHDNHKICFQDYVRTMSNDLASLNWLGNSTKWQTQQMINSNVEVTAIDGSDAGIDEN